jgi:hypothetical protein
MHNMQVTSAEYVPELPIPCDIPLTIYMQHNPNFETLCWHMNALHLGDEFWILQHFIECGCDSGDISYA